MARERTRTLRQELVRLLSEGPRTMRDLSQALGITEKDIPDHLASVEKTLKNKHLRLNSEPSCCLSCGFEFKDRKKYTKPGKCPQCRQSHIEPAVFWIETP